MKCVTIAKCKTGDILAEDIFNRFGIMVVSENTALNGYIIDKLKKMGIQQVRILQSRRSPCARSESGTYLQVREAYMKSISDIRFVVGELAAGKPLNADRIFKICERICGRIYDSHYILKVLNEVRNYDEYTYRHSLNVAFYSMLMAKWLHLSSDNIRAAVNAGLLHDIGKINVDIGILNKKGRLTREELNEIKKHTLYGYHMIKKTKRFSEKTCRAVLLHHERMDGSGYPLGIGCEELDIISKILAVADVYDAMTSDRVYKKKDSPFSVFEMLKTEGVKNFDPKIINTFLSNISVCYVGSKVFFDTGEYGEIVYIPPQSITEPVVRIGHSYIDLARNKSKNILSVVLQDLGGYDV